MRKASRDEELTVIILRKFDSDMLPKGRRPHADIDCHI